MDKLRKGKNKDDSKLFIVFFSFLAKIYFERKPAFYWVFDLMIPHIRS